MSKRQNSKYKISRRLGASLWGRAKDPVNNRPTPPGQHGAARRRKLSDFGVQLREKQKLKGYYGNVSEKQFRRIYAEAVRRKGDTGENLVGLLESRLDAVIYRMGFVPTVFAARQFVSHGHVMLNSVRTNVPSCQVKPGDVIEVRQKSREIPMVVETVQNPEREVPEYVEVDYKAMKGTYARMPKLMEIPYPIAMEPNLVIEFYSR